MTKIRKKILAIIIIILVFLTYGTKVYAATRRLKGHTELIKSNNAANVVILADWDDLGNSSIRNKINKLLGTNYTTAEQSLAGVVNMGYENHNTYCVQHEASNVVSDMRVKHYFKINGTEMVEHDYCTSKNEGASGGATYNCEENAILAYILANSIDSGECKWSNWTKSSTQVGTNHQNGEMDGPRQLALKKYWNTWLTRMGKKGVMSAGAWKFNSFKEKKYKYETDGNNAVADAKKNYSKYKKAAISATERNVSDVNPAISLTYTGTIDSVVVTAADGTTIPSNKIGFYKDSSYTNASKIYGLENIPKDGTSFYIKNISGKTIKSVNFHVKSNTYQVELWLLESTGYLGGEKLTKSKSTVCQKLITVKDKVVPTEANVTINYKYGSIKINKKDSKTKSLISGVAKFKIKTPTGKYLSGSAGSYNYNHASGTNYSTSGGKITLSELQVMGKYTIEEVQAPTGYKISTKTKSATISTSKPNPSTVVFYNTPDNPPPPPDEETESEDFSITIHKKDGETRKFITSDEAVFMIKTNEGYLSGKEGDYKYNNATKEAAGSKGKYTTTKGKLTLKGLKEGTYTAEEVEAPSRYLRTSTTQSRTISESNPKASAMVFYNTPTGSLSVIKKDSETGMTLKGSQFKIYKQGKGWLTGVNSYNSNKSRAKIYSTDAKGKLKIDGLYYGTYTIEEVTPPPGYILEVQEESIEVTISDSDRDPVEDYENLRKGSITIKKIDEETRQSIEGAGFKIKTSNGWLQGTKATTYKYNASYDTATIYRFNNVYSATDNVSYSKANGLKIDGLDDSTYHFYEVEPPTGYLLKHQEGYNANRGYVDTKKEVTISSEDSKYDQNVTITNVKKVSIEGYVWIDTPTAKSQEYNSLYDSRETKVEGITVRLINKENGKTFETSTFKEEDSNDVKYVFDSRIKYSELEKYYVEFDYSELDMFKTTYKDENGNEYQYSNYIPVAFNATARNGSKAMMKNVAPKDIDLTGIATTYTGQNAINTYGIKKCGTFDEKNLIYSNINLGIKKIPQANYSVSQNLAYAKIDINGFTFTYNYGQLGDNSMVIAPTTNWQKVGTISGYTADIYPSDIAYSVAQTDVNKKIKVFVVYRIDITNTTVYNIPELYEENKLRISSLKNYYDGNRYVLEKVYDLKNNNEITKDFDDWSEGADTTRNGKDVKVATYNLDKYKDGIGKNNTITSFIEFRVKDDAIKKILENPNGIIEEYPTEVESNGYHEYTRKDYSWDLNISANNQLHLTQNDIRSSAAPYLIFREHKDKERTIKGMVFEDEIVTKDGQKLGNGVYDSNENKVENIKVDLIEVPTGVTDLRQLSAENIKKLNPAIRYPKDATNKPKATNDAINTDKGGNYNLVGVVPGRYFLRFTYGDGTQKICDTSGKEIKTIVGKNYKSTVVKEVNAKAALNGGTEEEWYRDMDENIKASVALDNLNTRKIANESAEGKSDVMASTAKMSITVENNADKIFDMPKNTNSNSSQVTLSDSKDSKETIYAKYLNTIKAENTFNGLSFGIVEVPKQDAEIQKLITNVKLTNTQGNVLYNGNPETVASQGVVALSDLDNKKNGGSTYVKAEVQEESLYGTNLELTYEVKITNKSDINYYNNRYYWFGEKDENKEVTLTPTDVKDYLDETLTYVAEKSDKDRIVSKGTKTIVTEDEKNAKAEELDLTKWTPLFTNKITNRDARHPTSDNVKIVAQRILSNQDDDMEIVSRAEIKGIERTPDPNDTETQKVEQVRIAPKVVHTNGMVKATFTITPPTGENRSITTIYAIAGIISLIILSTGIVIIKKKVL